jgi:hypothetical protein
MLHVMPFAFVTACFANFRTGFAENVGQFALTRHEAGGQTTELRAIRVERNAAGHHVDIVFLQTRCRAMIAGDGACIACVDTSLELVVHDFSLSVAAGRWLFCKGVT